jgi:DNA-binding LacI/PurR family transcriptional regulator
VPKKRLKRRLKKQTAEKGFVAEYRRIEADLRARIQRGQWSAGAMLPGRRDLAREYGVSSVTVGRAILPLVTDGTLRADDRRGTFIGGTSVSGTGVAGAGPTRKPSAVAASTGVFGIVAACEPGKASQDTLILHALEQALSEAGHVTSVCNRTEGREHALLPLADSVQALLDRRVDAIALICLDLDRVRFEEELGRVDLHGTPTVCILAGALHLPIPHIFYDNRIGGYQAAKHLLDRGHREITVVAPFTASWVSERLEGIRDACAGAGLPPSALRVIGGEGQPWDYQGKPVLIGCRAARAAFEAGWTPRGGVICVNDFVALGLNEAAAERGWKPGRDYAVIGFDDEAAARSVRLTTMRPPLEAMGREAARLLLDEMRGGGGSHQLRLRAHLIPRASTHLRQKST